MRYKLGGALAVCGLFWAVAGANAQDAAPTPAAAPAPADAAPASAASDAPAVPPAALVLGDTVILRLYPTGPGPTPQQRVDALTTRLTNLLGTPNILPRDVVVYAPKGAAPTIYVLGRRLISADAFQSRASQAKTPLLLAQAWAARLQQVLPRINYRPSNAPEPDIPANPPLLVTDDFTKVGGMVGAVTLHGKSVAYFYGPQPHGLTAQERADQVSVHLGQAAHKIASGTTDAVKIVTLPAAKTNAVGAKDAKTAAKSAAANVETVEIQVNGSALVDITPAVAQNAHAASPQALAKAWAKNLRQALNLPDEDALPPIPAASVPNAAVPVVPAPGT